MANEINCIIVRDLASETDEETLKIHFAPYGNIIQAKIVRDDFGRSKKFGFVKFSDEISVRDLVERVDDIRVEEATIKLCNNISLNHQNGLIRADRVLKWRPAKRGYTAISSDGSHNGKRGGNGCIAISTNNAGSPEVRFAHAAWGSSNSAFEQEAKGMITALDIASKRGITHVEMRSDSLDLINCIKEPDRCPPEHQSLIQQIRELRRRFVDITFEFVFRELNQTADLLSKFFKTGSTKKREENGSKYFDSLKSLPPDIKVEALRDLGGRCPRERFLGWIFSPRS